jgi:hypothetical protein
MGMIYTCDRCGGEMHSGRRGVWHYKMHLSDGEGEQFIEPRHFDLCEHCSDSIVFAIEDREAVIYRP